jgi:hypothetical protein
VEAKERDLELALLNDVQPFLVEIGHGFALVGRQFPLRILAAAATPSGCRPSAPAG